MSGGESMGDHTARAEMLAHLAARRDELGHMLDALDCPPGAPFPARFGLPPHMPCQGITRRGTPCAAPAAIIGATGYCPWHDPELAIERRAWCAARRGSRHLRWFAHIAARYGGQSITPQVATHPDPVTAPLPALDLAALPVGQRRAVTALLAVPEGRTYAEAAAALGLRAGTLRRHLARVRAHHPALYAAAMVHRTAQLRRRHERAEARARQGRAAYRGRHRERFGREPWARR